MFYWPYAIQNQSFWFSFVIYSIMLDRWIIADVTDSMMIMILLAMWNRPENKTSSSSQNHHCFLCSAGSTDIMLPPAVLILHYSVPNKCPLKVLKTLNEKSSSRHTFPMFLTFSVPPYFSYYFAPPFSLLFLLRSKLNS